MADPFANSARRMDALAEEIPEEYVNLLCSRLLANAGEVVADLGCGTGTLSRRLARHGISVVGVDLSGAMLAEARQRAAARVKWVHDDVHHFLDGSGELAAAYSFESFHLFPKPEEVLARLAIRLRPRGVFALGWRMADWENQCSSEIVDVFEQFGVSFTDWGYWLYPALETHLGEEWTIPSTSSVETPSSTPVDEAIDFLCSIERFSHVVPEQREEFRGQLTNRLRRLAPTGDFHGNTTYGLTVVMLR